MAFYGNTLGEEMYDLAKQLESIFSIEQPLTEPYKESLLDLQNGVKIYFLDRNPMPDDENHGILNTY